MTSTPGLYPTQHCAAVQDTLICLGGFNRFIFRHFRFFCRSCNKRSAEPHRPRSLTTITPCNNNNISSESQRVDAVSYFDLVLYNCWVELCLKQITYSLLSRTDNMWMTLFSTAKLKHDNVCCWVAGRGSVAVCQYKWRHWKGIGARRQKTYESH